jgi:hypothetical protein
MFFMKRDITRLLNANITKASEITYGDTQYIINTDNLPEDPVQLQHYVSSRIELILSDAKSNGDYKDFRVSFAGEDEMKFRQEVGRLADESVNQAIRKERVVDKVRLIRFSRAKTLGDLRGYQTIQGTSIIGGMIGYIICPSNDPLLQVGWIAGGFFTGVLTGVVGSMAALGLYGLFPIKGLNKKFPLARKEDDYSHFESRMNSASPCRYFRYFRPLEE